MLDFEASQNRRKKRIDLLKRFCEGAKGEFANKVLARFQLTTGSSHEKALEYFRELKLAELVIVDENGKIKEVH